MTPSRAYLGALCALLAAAAVLGSPEQKLIEWVVSRGGQVGFEIGRECPTCLRGAVASKDFSEGDLIARVPVNSSIRFEKTVAFAAEHAHELVRKMYLEPEFNKTFAPVLATQSGPEDAFTPEVLSDASLELLQTPELERLAKVARNITELVYNGSYLDYQPISEIAGEGKVSMEQFKHLTAVLASHLFAFLAGGEQPSVFQVPIMEMLNHSEEPNAQRGEAEGEFFQINAIKPITKGEALTINYQPWVTHRSDMVLMHYGFVPKEDTPLLCAVDLPTYNPANPWAQTFANDISHEPGVGGFATPAEHARLAALLAAMPTTEVEDEALLAGGGLRDWRERTLVQFRVQRKKALRLVLEKLATVVESAAEL